VHRMWKVAAVAAVVVVLAACEPPGGTPNAEYQFNNDLRACGNDGPVLTNLGTGNTFATESVDGVSERVLRFGQNKGVRLSPTTGEVGNAVYTIVVLFRLSDSVGYDRIIEFKNGTGDNGLYHNSGFLYFYPWAVGSTDAIGENRWVQVALTRTAGKVVKGYVDGRQEFSFTDNANDGVISGQNVLRFFQDNLSNGALQEASAGAVARIRVWNKVLTNNEIANLGQTPGSACSTN
jgi:Concanavalin A-like lectin/glucanases superfamily